MTLISSGCKEMRWKEQCDEYIMWDFSYHNLPVVISNAGGMSEIIENNYNGIHFNILEPESLDSAIIRCLHIDKEK